MGRCEPGPPAYRQAAGRLPASRGKAPAEAWAHTSAGLARVWLEIAPDNLPSLRLAQRAGYRLEQRLRGHCCAWSSQDPAHDRWHDCLIWVHAR